MGESAASVDAALDAFGRVSFAMMDILRRRLGHAFGAFGFDPDESPCRIIGFGPHWRLRDYGGHDGSSSLRSRRRPSSGKLMHHIIQWLYRENRFCRGTLKVSEALVGPSSLSVPALAVVTMADDVAPRSDANVRIIQYPG